MIGVHKFNTIVTTGRRIHGLPAEEAFTRSISDYPLEAIDPWGATYCLVADPAMPTGSVYYSKTYGIISLGEDGRTLSNGNDPDDVRSWGGRLVMPEYYRKRFRTRNFLCFGIVFSLIVFVLSCVTRFASTPNKKEQKRCQ